ncbi:NIN-like protein [Artemisia annua]|uniref:NIN-like protein n=1 Tax=Artemisia annua TaxID=35608 RepID=A0A2U1QPB6_ARTAN|nr:NIN-like protein [Artemisia annua]
MEKHVSFNLAVGNSSKSRSSNSDVLDNLHMIKEKITSALKGLRFREKGVLVHFWSPVAVQKHWLLTTWDQPFGVCVADEGLYSYRLKSELRAIVVDGEDNEVLGPVGRVYSQKSPEWSTECKTYGYIDLPVFEPGGNSFVGVLEIITSSNYVDYSFEVHEFSKALKVAALFLYISDERRLHELDGIFKALKTVCDNHDLPLAQTWAQSEYDDVTELEEDDYPLVPFARMSGLTSCLAIYLKSFKLDIEYVIEFFFPARSADEADVQSLMKTVKQQIKNTSCMQLDIMLAPQVIGGLPFSWNLESSPSPITLLSEKEKDMENELSNSVAAGKSQSIILSLEKGFREFDINPGKKPRKRKRSESSIVLEEIEKHFGKTIDEAAAILHVSRSTLKRICRNLGIPRWPYRIGPCKTDSLIKSDQTYKTHDLVSLANNGKDSPLHKKLSFETIIENKVDYVMIKATYENNNIKFPFSFLDGLEKLKELITERFQLGFGSLRLKYVDEDNDLISVTSNRRLNGIIEHFSDTTEGCDSSIC